MSAIVLYGTRPSNPGDPTVLLGRCFPSLKLLSSRKLAQVIQESVHHKSKFDEPWKTHQWQKARKYLCQNLLPFLLAELHKKFLTWRPMSFGWRHKSFGCYRCKVSVRNATDFHHIYLMRNQELLMDWLCDPKWNPAYVRTSPFELSRDWAMLNYDNIYVRKAWIQNSDRSYLKLLSRCLPKMVHLKVIDLSYCSATAEVFDLLAKNCHLKKFLMYSESEENDFDDSEYVLDEKYIETDALLKFLQSQSHCLQEIEFESSLCSCKEDFAIQIWNVLAELRHLVKLKWISSSLISVIRERKIKPLQRLHTLELTIQEYRLIDKIPVDRMFPVLENYKLIYKPGDIEPWSESRKDRRNLSKVTSIDQRMDLYDVDEDEEFEIPSNFLEAFVNLHEWCCEGFSVIPEKLNLSNLTKMHCTQLENLSFDQLKAPFGSMPNLQHCRLEAKRISNFDQNSFISFLEETVKLRQKLTHLHLKIDRHPIKMTGATACAILQYSQIKRFEELSSFKFTSKEMEKFERLARQKYLTILPAYKSGEKFHPCDSGFF